MSLGVVKPRELYELVEKIARPHEERRENSRKQSIECFSWQLHFFDLFFQ